VKPNYRGSNGAVVQNARNVGPAAAE
jgi:hypothetical protein